MFSFNNLCVFNRLERRWGERVLPEEPIYQQLTDFSQTPNPTQFHSFQDANSLGSGLSCAITICTTFELAFLLGYRTGIAVDVRGSGRVGASYEFLLHTNRSTRLVQERTIGVFVDVPTEFGKTDCFSGWLQDLQPDDARVVATAFDVGREDKAVGLLTFPKGAKDEHPIANISPSLIPVPESCWRRLLFARHVPDWPFKEPDQGRGSSRTANARMTPPQEDHHAQGSFCNGLTFNGQGPGSGPIQGL